jgi:hypothetical protein
MWPPRRCRCGCRPGFRAGARRWPAAADRCDQQLLGDAARPRRTGDRRSYRRQAQQLEQGPWELADALVELARQQSQKRPVPATARFA